MRNGHAVPALQGELLFATVHDWLPRADDLARGQTLDLSQVTRCDSAGLSLLLELKRRARHHGGDLTFHGPTPQVAALAGFFGIGGLLGLSGV